MVVMGAGAGGSNVISVLVRVIVEISQIDTLKPLVFMARAFLCRGFHQLQPDVILLAETASVASVPLDGACWFC